MQTGSRRVHDCGTVSFPGADKCSLFSTKIWFCVSHLVISMCKVSFACLLWPGQKLLCLFAVLYSRPNLPVTDDGHLLHPRSLIEGIFFGVFGRDNHISCTLQGGFLQLRSESHCNDFLCFLTPDLQYIFCVVFGCIPKLTQYYRTFDYYIEQYDLHMEIDSLKWDFKTMYVTEQNIRCILQCISENVC